MELDLIIHHHMCPTQHHDKLYLKISIRNFRAQFQKWKITTGFTKVRRFLLQVTDYFKKDPAEGAASTQTEWKKLTPARNRSTINLVYKATNRGVTTARRCRLERATKFLPAVILLRQTRGSVFTRPFKWIHFHSLIYVFLSFFTFQLV